MILVVIVIEVVVKAMVEVEVQLLFWVGGWSDKMKLISWSWAWLYGIWSTSDRAMDHTFQMKYVVAL